jgi:hypothetical protein
VFAGRRYQRGHGLGSIFGGLFKAAMPLLKKGAKTLEREALKTGLNMPRWDNAPQVHSRVSNINSNI